MWMFRSGKDAVAVEAGEKGPKESGSETAASDGVEYCEWPTTSQRPLVYSPAEVSILRQRNEEQAADQEDPNPNVRAETQDEREGGSVLTSAPVHVKLRSGRLEKREIKAALQERPV